MSAESSMEYLLKTSYAGYELNQEINELLNKYEDEEITAHQLIETLYTHELQYRMACQEANAKLQES